MLKKVKLLVQNVRTGLTPTMVVFVVLIGLLSSGIGWLLPSPTALQKYTGGVLRQTDSSYQFINPLLACDIGAQEVFTELAPLKKAVAATVARNVQEGKAKNISIYFRSTKNAHWFDINPATTYAPASLLKVFVMMAYYKETDQRDMPGLLQKLIPFQGSPNSASDQPGEVIPHLISGRLYTVDQIIKQMIVYSDNDALNTLIATADAKFPETLNEIFSDLKITSPLTDENTYAMGVDQYSLVLRVLIASTYLSRDYSERALDLLSQAHYQGGLVAGVPPAIKVAHKFGDTTVVSTSSPPTPELHDCGIIYYPSNPYILCVMTQGSSFATLQGVIRDISAVAYQEFSKLHPPKK